MQILKSLLALSLAFSGPSFAADGTSSKADSASASAAGATVKPYSPVEQGVKVFNMIQSASKLFLALKVGASADDEEYLESMSQKYTGQRLPKATAKNGAIYLQGLERPIKVEDLSKGLFSYNGKTFDVNLKDGVEKGLDGLNGIVFPKSVLLQWILPEAQASIDPMLLLASMAGVGGLAVAANSCGDGPNNSTMGCGIGGLMGGFGLGYLIASLLNDKNPPQNMTCYPGQNGCQQVVLMGANRVPVNTISQCPGQPYNYSPALSQVPPAQGQYMASQLSGMCPYPGMMTTMNTAYAAPTIFPLQQQQPLRPVAPNILPYSVRPQSAGVMKPPATAVKPQSMTIKPQTTTSEPGGAAK
jgi:hypothetical protein